MDKITSISLCYVYFKFASLFFTSKNFKYSVFNGYRRINPELVDTVEITSGSWGVVFKGRSNDGSDVVVKVVPTHFSSVEATAFERLRQYQSSGQLHPRKHGSLMCARFSKYDEQNLKTLFVMDYHSGESLLSFISRHPEGVSEERARPIIEGMLDCVELVHQMDMIHLDLKAEHFVIGKETGLVLVDFGAAFLCSENGCSPRTDLMSMGRSHYGTLTYSAPETFRDECCTGSDMWSIGVLTYALLIGDPPWLQDGTQEKYIRTASFNLTCARWQHLSANGRAFIESLLRVEPEQRMSLADCRSHDFLRGT